MEMPKIKTRKAAAKRFEIRASGKVRRSKANKQHILTKKTRSRKNRLKKAAEVHTVNMAQLRRCLPNG
jgi:large subunit ribosomal protein L35